MKKYLGEKANTGKFKLDIHCLLHNWCPCCIFLIQYGYWHKYCFSLFVL